VKAKIKVAHIQLLPILSGVQKVSAFEIEGLKHDYHFSLVCAHEGPLTELLNGSLSSLHYVASLKREISFFNDFFILRTGAMMTLVKDYQIWRC
jgi:hypothetical protein